MKISKEALEAARRFAKICTTGEGSVDEAGVNAVITKLRETQPRNHKSILVAFKNFIEIELKKGLATIESAVELTPDVKQSIEASLTQKYNRTLSFIYTITPELLGGVKVRVGDDLIDNSVQAKIEKLSAAF